MDTSVSLSIRSQDANSDSEDGEEERSAAEVHVPAPYMHHGGEPLRKHISRTQEVSKSTWESFLSETRGRRNSGVFAVVLEPPVHMKSKSRIWNSSFGRKAADDERRIHRSVCGWPTLSPYGTLAVWWSGFMMLFDAIYTAFMVPIVIAFDPQALKGWSTVVEFVAGTLFCVDIVLNFTFGYIISYDFKKKVVMKGSSIFWYYLRDGGAWMDFLAVSPFVYEIVVTFGGGTEKSFDDLSIDVWLTILRLARLLRLIRTLRVIFTSSMNFGTGESLAAYFINITYCGAVMVNMLGCLLFAIARWEGLETSWLSEYEKKFNFVDAEDVVRIPPDSSFPRLYLASIYWATVTITTVGYGDITPVTAAETVVVMFVMVTHVVLFGLLVGSAAEMLKNSSKSSRQASRLRRKLACVGNWITHRGLSTEVEKKVRSYYNEVWSGGAEYSEAQLLGELPVALRSEIILSLVGPTLRRLRMFRGLTERLLEVAAGRLSPVSVAPGHEICRQGDVAERVLILTEGKIHGFVDNVMVDKLCPPATIGEESVLVATGLKTITHFTSYRSITSCHFWELKRQDLVALCDAVPNMKNELLMGCKDNIEANLRHSERVGGRSIGALNAWKGLLHHLDDAKEFTLARSTHVSQRDEVPEEEDRDETENVTLGTIQPRKRVRGDEKRTENAVAFSDRSLLTQLKNQLADRGVHGLVGFAKELEGRMEVAAPLGFGVEAFKGFLASQGLEVSDAVPVCDKFITGSTVLWRELIKDLAHPGISSDRLYAVERAFERLVESTGGDLGTGMIPLTRLLGAFRAELHPDVAGSVKSAFTVTSELLSAFQGVNVVTRADFLKYFSFVSVCVAEDGTFERLCGIFFDHEV
ncbi:hypothetical protein BSKO_13994 [Bryopsis sp. KO-2023]|nr:hypothetical protein BSKO_13994 [Bryopsis sp. KO-2023]